MCRVRAVATSPARCTCAVAATHATSGAAFHQCVQVPRLYPWVRRCLCARQTMCTHHASIRALLPVWVGRCARRRLRSHVLCEPPPLVGTVRERAWVAGVERWQRSARVVGTCSLERAGWCGVRGRQWRRRAEPHAAVERAGRLHMRHALVRHLDRSTVRWRAVGSDGGAGWLRGVRGMCRNGDGCRS